MRKSLINFEGVQEVVAEVVDQLMGDEEVVAGPAVLQGHDVVDELHLAVEVSALRLFRLEDQVSLKILRGRRLLTNLINSEPAELLP